MSAVVKHEGILPPEQVGQVSTLLQVIERAASNPQVDIEKMERLMQMHERIVARDAEIAFNNAMRECQKECGYISADANNPQTKSKYATFAKLDSVLRPIYTKHGFSLSFDEGETSKPEYVRVVCYVSHAAGHTRTYHRDMPADGKGAKGGDVMTKTHAAGAAGSYGARYLLKGIFNVQVGEEDRDGNDSRMDEELIAEWIAKIEAKTTKEAAKEVWREAVKVAESFKDVYASKKLKEALIAHGDFIDKAAK